MSRSRGSAGGTRALRQIEYQNLGVRAAVQLKLRRPRGARAIPGLQAGAVHGHRAARHLQPRTPAGCNRAADELFTKQRSIGRAELAGAWPISADYAEPAIEIPDDPAHTAALGFFARHRALDAGQPTLVHARR